MFFKNTLPALAGLVAVAKSAAINDALLVERQLVCPAGYGPMGSAVVTTNIVLTPVVINNYFEDNTIINIFGNTININNAPTSVVTTVTATSTVTTTVTAGAAVATPFILGIAPIAVVKRQAGPSYVGGGGSTVADCGSASVFNIVDGQINSGGLLVSTGPGTSFAPFGASSVIGEISTTFSASGSSLIWTNPAFANGTAAFVSFAGTIEAVFNGTIPAGSISVSLSIIPASACPALSSSSSSSVASSTTTGISSLSTSGFTNATTTTGATTTSGSVTVTTTTASPSVSATGAFAISVTLPPTRKARRQAATYIGAGGAVVTDPTLAEAFFIVNGQLFSNDGQISTNMDNGFQPFAASNPVGSITTTFAAAGTLTWVNGNFTNGAASFCVLNDVIEFVFVTAPTGCATVILAVVPLSSLPTSSASITSTSSVPALTTSSSFSSSITIPPILSTSTPFPTGNSTTILPTGGLRRH